VAWKLWILSHIVQIGQFCTIHGSYIIYKSKISFCFLTNVVFGQLVYTSTNLTGSEINNYINF
jgi:hypothetical protein